MPKKLSCMQLIILPIKESHPKTKSTAQHPRANTKSPSFPSLIFPKINYSITTNTNLQWVFLLHSKTEKKKLSNSMNFKNIKTTCLKSAVSTGKRITIINSRRFSKNKSVQYENSTTPQRYYYEQTLTKEKTFKSHQQNMKGSKNSKLKYKRKTVRWNKKFLTMNHTICKERKIRKWADSVHSHIKCKIERRQKLITKINLFLLIQKLNKKNYKKNPSTKYPSLKL